MKNILIPPLLAVCIISCFTSLSAQTYQSDQPPLLGEYECTWTDALTGKQHTGTATITYGHCPGYYGLSLPEGYEIPIQIQDISFPYLMIYEQSIASIDDYTSIYQFPEINGDSKDRLNLQWDTSDNSLLLPEGFSIKIGKKYKWAVTKQPEIWWHAKEITLFKTNSSVTTTTIENVNAIIYYNLQGSRISQPEPGMVVIRVCDGHAAKVIIK